MTQDDPRVTQDDPRVTQDDPRVIQDDLRVTQDDPRVIKDDPRVTQDDLRVTQDVYHLSSKIKQTQIGRVKSYCYVHIGQLTRAMIDYVQTRQDGVAPVVVGGGLGEVLGLELHKVDGEVGVLIWVLLHVLRV